MYHEGLEKLLKDFEERRKPKISLFFIAICLLYKKGKYEFTINDVANEVNNLLQKFKHISPELQNINLLSVKLGNTFPLLNILQIEKRDRNIYKLNLDKLNSELIDYYFGKFMFVLLEKYVL